MNLDQLEAESAFSMLDVELARSLCRLAKDEHPALLLAVALASREVQRGHTCANLPALAGTPIFDAPDAPRFPALETWLRALTPLTGEAGPLVLDAQQRLYLARYHDHERALAALIRGMLGSTEAAPSELASVLFPSVLDKQRDAALNARRQRFSVIVGGPGTGKTSTVVKLLALLVDDALRAQRPPPRTLLVAPTGKAAQRLTEAIERARDALPVEDAVKQAIASKASTVHRALGPLDGSLARFRHGPERPLDCDVLLLDEASMVDLALMRRLLSAVPGHARVILLGDPDQLASVEAGGVLFDICRAAEQGSLGQAVSRLTVSYRYPEHSGIAALARAVHKQSPEEALEVLRAGHPDVSFGASPRPHELGRALEQEARATYAGLRNGDVEARLQALDRFRVLSAHRSGPASVEQLNPLLSRALGPDRGTNYAGRPIIITQNDYATQLFNGDVGVLHSLVNGRKRELIAAFREGEARRDVSLARLPTHESAYAMTVHKSQGSEFDRVAIVLPERPSRLLSRELLYTAITRAKSAVSLYSSEASLRAAIQQRSERNTGLVDRLTRRTA
ncbi:MAG TPA: exodeoxyribonuclease V subunit alpha [Polyangiales bacterium]|nr:exodeoxyribonuclease V subunit alpha [Polyangiales bacterium]